jgi:hypothetical protein
VSGTVAEEGGPGLSLAMPPLYVLRTVERCPECGRPLQVYALGCAAFQNAEDDTPLEEFHFLHHVRGLPARVLAILSAQCRGYRLDETGAGGAYLINHCPCGARLDDEFLHGDVGAAFWPATPEGFRRLRLYLLPIREAVPIDSSYTLGGGENLDFAHAESW